MKRNGNAEIEMPKAPRGVGSGEGVPLPSGGGVWRGGRAPSPEFFLIFCLAMVHFGAL